MYRKKEGIEHSNYNWDNVKKCDMGRFKISNQSSYIKITLCTKYLAPFFWVFLREVTSHKPWSVFDFMLA